MWHTIEVDPRTHCKLEIWMSCTGICALSHQLLLATMRKWPNFLPYRVEQKKIKLCSVTHVASGLYIGCPRLVGRKKAANSNMLEFFAPLCRWVQIADKGRGVKDPEN